MSRNGVEQSLGEAMAAFTVPGLASVDVRGNAAREKDLSVPYRGKRLFGAELRAQIDTWVRDGIAEPGFAVAMHTLLDNPEWLDLTDVDVAVLGASAEMGPTRSLLRWGARIHAVDLPRPGLWEKLIQTTRSTAGAMRIPIALDAEGQPPFVVGGNAARVIEGGRSADAVGLALRGAAGCAAAGDDGHSPRRHRNGTDEAVGRVGDIEPPARGVRESAWAVKGG